MEVPAHLSEFLDGRPSIKVTLRSDPDFDSSKRVFLDTPDVPLLIARPRNESDVSALVSHLSSTSTPLVVRAGGHDLSMRSVAHDAVQIDIRGLDYVRVSEDKRTARIGGGILTQNLLDGLATERLMTAAGNTGTVGWCSWAMNGGYGIVSGKYGLGCDQILGARVVLANGTVVEADERLLKALRGAGATLGVVVEMHIKVYPLTEVGTRALVWSIFGADCPQITAGLISYTSGIQTSLATYFDNMRSLIDSGEPLPEELYVQPMIMPVPVQGPVYALQFVWAGAPSDEQSVWLKKMKNLVPGGTVAVEAVTPGNYTREITKMIDSHLRGGEGRTVSIRSLVPSAEAADIIARNASLITPDWGAVFIHMANGPSFRPEAQHPQSVFASRETHLMVEILGFAYQDAASMEPAIQWCRNTHKELTMAKGVMDEAYLPLMDAKALQLNKTYKKDSLDFLRALKKELDPNNVFYNPIPLAE